jgi:hypothetical protein
MMGASSIKPGIRTAKFNAFSSPYLDTLKIVNKKNAVMLPKGRNQLQVFLLKFPIQQKHINSSALGHDVCERRFSEILDCCGIVGGRRGPGVEADIAGKKVLQYSFGFREP